MGDETSKTGGRAARRPKGSRTGWRSGLGTGSTVRFAMERLAERVRDGLSRRRRSDVAPDGRACPGARNPARVPQRRAAPGARHRRRGPGRPVLRLIKGWGPPRRERRLSRPRPTGSSSWSTRRSSRTRSSAPVPIPGAAVRLHVRRRAASRPSAVRGRVREGALQGRAGLREAGS